MSDSPSSAYPIRDIDLRVGSVVGRAWQAFKERWGLLLGATLILALVFVLFAGIVAAITDPKGPDPVDNLVAELLVRLLYSVVSTAITAGGIVLLLKVLRGEPASVIELFVHWRPVFYLIVVNILLGIVIFVGFILLIVPGLYLIGRLSLTPFFLVDQKLGPFQAIDRSWDATKGQGWRVCLLLLVGALIGMAGFLAFVVGLLFTIPLSYLVYAVAYQRLIGEAGDNALSAAETNPPGGGI